MANSGRQGVLTAIKYLLVAGTALSGLACGGSPTGTDDEQRLRFVEGVIDKMMSECCQATREAFDLKDDIDVTWIPGIDWPIEVPNVVPETDYNHLAGYTFSYIYADSLKRWTSTWNIQSSDDNVRSRRAYTWEELYGPNPTRWSTAVYADLTLLDGDTIRVRTSFYASESRTGLCPLRPCQNYMLSIEYMLTEEPQGAVWEPLPGGRFSVQLEETETMTRSGSDVMVAWYSNGTFLTDGMIDVTTSSGSLGVRDTLPLCP